MGWNVATLTFNKCELTKWELQSAKMFCDECFDMYKTKQRVFIAWTYNNIHLTKNIFILGSYRIG